MNTNSNIYTIVYTTLIVVVVAAVLAFAAMTLKPKQDANIKAETISQMLTAAGFASKEDLSNLSNEQVLASYSEKIKTAFLIDAQGQKVGELETELGSIELADNLKLQNTNIKNNADLELPVYVFDKNGSDVYVIPVYGAGLWGPIWGYVAFDEHCDEIVGAYFDHDSETPGLGAKIKDEPWFREQFVGETINYDNPASPFEIIKGGAPDVDYADAKIDAITGATMTCNGLSAALNTWFSAYMPFLKAKYDAAECDGDCNEEGHHHNHPEEV